MKHEVLLAKIVAAVITLLTLVGIARADEAWIDNLFSRYRAPQGLTGIVISAGEKFGIDPKIIAAIIVVESSARPKAVSKGGDYGLMQIRWKVHNRDIQRRFPQESLYRQLDEQCREILGKSCEELLAEARRRMEAELFFEFG